MDREHRYVVVGDGDVGAATAYRLARAVGERVLVLDAAASPPEDEGVVRADLAHPDDARTALAPAAYEAWRDLERLSGQSLLTTTTGLVIGGDDRPEVGRCTAVADRHGLDFAVLDALGVVRRWPQFRPGPRDHAFVQARSGLLDAGRAAAVHRLLAAGHGAELRHGAVVQAVRPADDHVEVVLDDGVLRAEHVVLAAGAGTATLLAPLRPLPLAEHTEQSARYTTSQLLEFCPSRFPVFSWYGTAGDDTAHVTGIGAHGGVATRLTEHGPAPDAERRRAFLAARVPGFSDGAPEHATRTRTVTTPADRVMAIGPLPGVPRIGVAVGTGRHPMFAGVAGRALADLALTGRSRPRVSPFAPDRRALDPTGPAGAAGRSR